MMICTDMTESTETFLTEIYISEHIQRYMLKKVI